MLFLLQIVLNNKKQNNSDFFFPLTQASMSNHGNKSEISQQDVNQHLCASMNALANTMSNLGQRVMEMPSGQTHGTEGHMPQLKLKEPKEYSGTRDAMVIDEWVRSVEMHQEFFQLTQSQTLLFATSHLSGRANAWYRSMEFKQKAPDSWHELKEQLILKFRPDNVELLARDRFSTIVQTSSIQDYVNRFMDICISLPNVTDDECCDKFMRGVQSNQLRADLRGMKGNQRTIENYYNVALAWEGARDFNYKPNDSNAVHVGTHQDSSSSTVEPIDLDTMKDRRGKSWSKAPSKPNKVDKKCHYCHAVGHVKYKCFKRKRDIEALDQQHQQGHSQLHVITDQAAISTTDDNSSVAQNHDNKNNTSAHYPSVDVLNSNHELSSDLHIVSEDVPVILPAQDHVQNFLPYLPIELLPVLDCHEACITADIPRLVELNTHCTSDLPLYKASVWTKDNRTLDIKILVDTGASECYLSSRLSKKIVGGYSSVDRAVETASGTIDKITEKIVFNVDIQGYKCTVSAFVYKSKFDLILGRSWLKLHKPDVIWEDDTLRFVDKLGKQCVVYPNMEGGKNPGMYMPLNYLIWSKQADKCIRSGDEAFFLYVMDNQADEVQVLPANNEFWKTVIEQYPTVFQDGLPGLPPDRGFEHVIDTQNSKPINRQAYRMSPGELDELKKQLRDLLSLGLIRPSSSPYGLPVLFVRKQDGSKRMCVDYRALNKVTVKNSSPLPRIDECLDRLQGASYFTTLDLKSGYHQIPIKESDIPKTAFNTRYGKFEFLVLPFGLSNAPPSFQTWMNSLLGDMIDRFVLVYLDDVCIFSKTEEEHKDHVKQVLEKFKEEKLVVNIKKCHFGKRKLSFLGYDISSDGISPLAEKIKAIKNWPRPSNVQEVRQFIGLSQHYRRFIPSFSSVASPLTELTCGTGSKKRAITWTPACEESFNKIKTLLTSAPVLQMPDLTMPFVIETDFSDYGVGGVLLQPAVGRARITDIKRPYGNFSTWHPVAYESKKLSKEEQKFPAQERELIGIVHALRVWRCFIEGCAAGYTVYSDHNPLVYFRQKANPTSRLVRWISELELYAPNIQYKPGVDNTVADALSRLPEGNNSDQDITSMEPEYLYALDHLPLSIRQDWPLLYMDNKFEKVEDNELKRHLLKEKSNFRIESNLIYRKVKFINQSKALVEKEVKYVPFSNRADLVAKFHEGLGHAGTKKLYTLFRERYWWPHMKQDLDNWISTCPWCQLNSRKPSAHQHELRPLPVPHAFERWHIDFVGELPLTKHGNKWLITAVDYATNWPIAKAMPVASKEAVALFIYEEIVVKFGCPIEVVTDRAANFCSGLVEEYLKRIGVHHKLTSAFCDNLEIKG